MEPNPEKSFYAKLHSHNEPLTRREMHEHFGGVIYNSDFDMRYKQNAPIRESSEIANRIMSDLIREKRTIKTEKRRALLMQTDKA